MIPKTYPCLTPLTWTCAADSIRTAWPDLFIVPARPECAKGLLALFPGPVAACTGLRHDHERPQNHADREKYSRAKHRTGNGQGGQHQGVNPFETASEFLPETQP